VSDSHAQMSKLHSCVWKSHFACKITLCGLKLHFACRNHSFVRLETTICVWKLDSACRNHTLRVESFSSCINYTRECVNHTLRVEIALCVWELDSGGNYTLRVEITLVHRNYTLRVKSQLFVYKLRSWVSYLHEHVSKVRSAGRNWTLRVEIIRCMWTLDSAWRNQTLRKK
jgi:hypothetical protein